MSASTLKTVTKSVARIDGIDKVRGQARFAGEIELPHMAYGKILRSPLPHAKVVKIDTKEAEKIPGVIAILTKDDFKDIDPYFGPALKDRPILAIDKVRHVGDPVAAIAALDEYTAEEALQLIEVEYEELPVVDNIDTAVKPDASLIHDQLKLAKLFKDLASIPSEEQKNIPHHFDYGRGSLETGFERADQMRDK